MGVVMQRFLMVHEQVSLSLLVLAAFAVDLYLYV
jgi:hypothetical protein